MTKRIISGVLIAVMLGSSPAFADSYVASAGSNAVRVGKELPPYLQCVPYARAQSGIQIYGDAHTWWDQAEGRFERGSRPKIGAVMAFEPHRNMRLGHVAAVSKIIDSRTVLLRHSNWSPINGRRGQIENDVKAIDVSPRNDWSQVRVWYHPIQGLGKTAWPIHGFIYPNKTPSFSEPVRMARAAPTPAPVSRKASRRFTSAFADLNASPRKHYTATRTVPRATTPRVASIRRPAASDPVKAAISLYD